jgi:hypothetical protein
VREDGGVGVESLRERRMINSTSSIGRGCWLDEAVRGMERSAVRRRSDLAVRVLWALSACH